MKYRFAWTLLFLAALMAAIAVRVQGLPEAESDAGATYTNGTLQVTIPYRGIHAGTGQLTVEVLSPEDEVIGRLERRVEVGAAPGAWSEAVQLSKALPVEDLVWHRLRYRFIYSGQTRPAVEGTDSISSILRRPVVHILGQRSYLAGGNAAVRVIVTDTKNQPVAGGSTLRIEGAKGQLLYAGRLNARGTAEAQFRLPAGVTGGYTLRYAVETPVGAAEYREQVRLEDKASILLTTEKPIYQPGQTMHVRALALDRARHEAMANRALTFEVEDSRGNKVFKNATQTDRFGIASAEFGLADEVNLGTYHVRALMGENRAELALKVERYVLPKFKVAVEFATRRQARLPPGRPRDRDGARQLFLWQAGGPGRSHGEGFGDGCGAGSRPGGAAARPMPTARIDSTCGCPLISRGGADQGAARVLIEATVKDSAGHAETRGEPVTVSESPLLITAVPEGGTLVAASGKPGFRADFLSRTAAPAATDLTVHAQGNADQNVNTDAGGVAVVRRESRRGRPSRGGERRGRQPAHDDGAAGIARRARTRFCCARSARCIARATAMQLHSLFDEAGAGPCTWTS